MHCMSKRIFNLKELKVSISKIAIYSSDFDTADDFYHDQESFDACMM